MADLTAQQIDRSGLNPSLQAAAAGGDRLRADIRTFLWVDNADTVAHTVTVVTSRQVSGLAVDDVAVSVPAGEQRMIGGGPNGSGFDSQLYADADGWVDITYDAATSLTVAAVRL